CIIFFYSSRSRHTRSKRDWSSDVCSSDLGELFSMSSKSDASLIRDLLYITNPDFEFSEVVYPNNIGRGVGVSNGYLAYDINENHSSFNLAIFNNGGGKAFNSN